MSEDQLEGKTEEQMADELGQQINYVRQWLECAPDFQLLMQVFMFKIIIDRGNQQPENDEMQRIGAWVEMFYKSMSAILGVMESHIRIEFPEGREPHVTITESGAAWIRERQAEHEAQQKAEGA